MCRGSFIYRYNLDSTWQWYSASFISPWILAVLFVSLDLHVCIHANENERKRGFSIPTNRIFVRMSWAHWICHVTELISWRASNVLNYHNSRACVRNNLLNWGENWRSNKILISIDQTGFMFIHIQLFMTSFNIFFFPQFFLFNVTIFVCMFAEHAIHNFISSKLCWNKWKAHAPS